MIPPSTDPRYRAEPVESTWRGVLVSYALVAAIPAVLWVAAHPSTRLVAVAALAGLYVGANRVHGVYRCLRDCRALAFDCWGAIRITVTRPPDLDADACCT